MHKPPEFIDNANVLYWSVAGKTPFGFIISTDGNKSKAIFGICVCQYKTSNKFCRFYCDKNWKVIQDNELETLDAALTTPTMLFEISKITWKKYE